METQPCLCSQPGFCPRYQREQTPHLHKLCQTREDYRRHWDEKPKPGLGDIVEKFLKYIGFKKKCGGCAKRKAWLNKWRAPW